MTTGRVWAVLPAYNEAANLPALLSGLRELARDAGFSVRVIVVDDGSSDETAAVAGRGSGTLAVEVLRNGTNLGLAKTFRRGMMEAARLADPADAIVCMDADNSHLPGQITAMTEVLDSGCEVVIASRYRPGAVVAGVPWARRALAGGMSVLFRTVLPIRGVRDYSCGYRAYRAGFLQAAIARKGEALFAEEGFSCMVGILAHLAREGATFNEVPLILRYDQKVGASKMQVGRTIARTLIVLARARFGRL